MEKEKGKENCCEFIIVTGMSGSGKTQACRYLEDIGYFVVDNLPPVFIPKFAELCQQSGGSVSKVVLVVTAALILLPALYFFFLEFGHLPVGERILASLFQAVTPRTAGFNTVDLAAISDTGVYLMMILMLIGGSPGSTAGGMKTTTIAVLFSSAFSVFRKKDNAELMRRRIDDATVKTASAICIMYVTLFLAGGMAISTIEHLPITLCLYESASAVGTVGLTLGITPTLGTASKLILMVSMFFGRVGGLTLIYAAFGAGKKQAAKLPIDTIAVG